MNTITKFVVKSEFHSQELKSSTFDDAINEIYDSGYVNCGKVRLLKIEYREISCTPFIVNTDYNCR